MAYDTIPLPPAPAPLPAEYTAEQWDRAWRYADLLVRIENGKNGAAHAAAQQATADAMVEAVQVQREILAATASGGGDGLAVSDVVALINALAGALRPT